MNVKISVKQIGNVKVEYNEYIRQKMPELAGEIWQLRLMVLQGAKVRLAHDRTG
jgi:hypothetical protein